MQLHLSFHIPCVISVGIPGNCLLLQIGDLLYFDHTINSNNLASVLSPNIKLLKPLNRLVNNNNI